MVKKENEIINSDPELKNFLKEYNYNWSDLEVSFLNSAQNVYCLIFKKLLFLINI